MGRQRKLFGALATIVAVVCTGVGGLAGTGQALVDTSQPTLTLNRLIRTSPFVGSSTSVRDNEGTAYVASDDALWIIDDNGNAVYELDRATGALRRKIGLTEFSAVRQLGGTATAGSSRAQDLEALAYDANADTLYAFSGSTSSTPAVYRLTRNASTHLLTLNAWQSLPSEWTGAGWRLADGTLYVANDKTFRPYDFASNTFGTAFTVTGLSKVYGVDFDDVTGDLVAVNGSEKVYRVSMATKQFKPGWNGVDLTRFGIEDSRGVEVIGDQLFVSDGADTRSSSDPMNHAVFVLDVTGPSSGPSPTASFTASATSGSAPLAVTFTDTSTGSPTSWAWSFGDGATSTTRSPSHTYAAGTFTATLTASNANGSTTASRTITVTSAPTGPTASFTASSTSGSAPLAVTFTDTSTGSPTSWAWEFGDGATSTTRSPSHTYVANGTYTAKLTATNAQGSTSATKTITVTSAPPPPTTIPLDADAYFNTDSPTKNYGAYTVMKLHSPTSAEYRPIVKFTLAGLSRAPTSVKVRLYVTDASVDCGSWYLVDNGWTESGVNWNNKPVVGGSPVATVGNGVAGQWVEIDVTSAVSGNGTYSFEATSGSTNTAAFSSREDPNAPQVLIVP